MTNRQRLGVGVVCAVALAVGGAIGCDDDDEVGNVPSGTGGAGGMGMAGAGGGPGGTTGATPLNDARIAAIMLEANAGEVHAAEIAKSRSMNTAVLAFADLMITEHTSATDRMQQLLDQKSMTTEDSAQRRSLGDQAAQVLDRLWAAPAGSFDAVYADSQAMMHGMVLQMLDTMMIPATQDPQLRAELEATRTRVAMHLTQAQMLQAQVGPVGSSTGAGGATGNGSGTGTGSGGTSGTGGAGGTLGTGVNTGMGTGTRPIPITSFGGR